MQQTKEKTLRRTAVKLALALSVCAFTAVLLFFGHLYRHPAALKGLLENVLAAKTGGIVKIAGLAYGMDPLHLHARGISLQSGPEGRKTTLAVKSLSADFSLSGPFGRRILKVERLAAEGFSLELRPPFATVPPAGKNHTLLNRITGSLAGYFFFREVRWGQVALADGRVFWAAGKDRIACAGLSALRDPEGRLRIAGSLRYRNDARSLDLFLERVTLASPKAVDFRDPLFQGEIHVAGGTLESAVAAVGGARLQGRLSYRRSDSLLAFTVDSLAGEQIRWNKAAGNSLALPFPALTVRGQWNVAQGRWSLPAWGLKIPDTADLAGTAALDAADLQIELAKGSLQVAPVLLPLLDGLLPAGTSFRGGGGVDVRGRLHRAARQGKAPQIELDVEVRLRDNPLVFTARGSTLAGKASGGFRVNGRLPRPAVDFDVSGQWDPLTFGPVELDAFTARLAGGGTYPVFDPISLEARISSAAVARGSAVTRLRDVTLDMAGGRIDLAEGRGAAAEITFASERIRNVRGSIRRDGRQWQVSAGGQDTGLAAAAVSLGLVPEGWRLSATDVFQVGAEIDSNGGLNFTATAAVTGGALESPDESLMAENLSLQLSLEGRLDPATRQSAFLCRATGDAGEILWGRFYGDLVRHPLEISGRGRWQDTLVFENLRLSAGGLLTLVANGTYGPEAGLQARLSLPAGPLEPLYRFFVLDPLRFEKPWLADISLHGTVAAELQAEVFGSHRRLKGRLHWENGRLQSPSHGVSLEGIRLDLPIWFDPSAENPAESPMEGSLGIAKADVPLLTEPSLEAAFDVGPQALEIRLPPRLQAASGEIRLGPVRIVNPFSPGAVLKTDIAIQDLPWRLLVPARILPGLAGTINGQLADVTVDRSRLKTRGALFSDVFDGRVTAVDPGIHGLLSAAPVLSTDVRLDRLNLEQITRGTEFGKIQGLVSGYIHGLEIVGGEPQAFDLRMETVPSDKIPQKISVRAVENISRIGGGTSPFGGLAGAFASTLKEFRYSRIGAAAVLHNDVFHVSGTIHENDLEYLVKGAIFLGVNVINRNPDNRISFDDMVSRIKRIGFGRQQPVHP